MIAIGRWFLCQGIVVEVWTLRRNPKRWTRENSRVQGCTSSFEKTPLFAKKWGSPVVGRSQAGTAGAHIRCSVWSLVPSAPRTTSTG